MKRVTLNEWIHLSLEERKEIQQAWKENWNEGFCLLEEAAEDFKKKYRHIPGISRVVPVAKYIADDVPPYVYKLIGEPWINVITSLKENEFIKELPSEYAHFKVIQEPFADIGLIYLEKWKVILKNIIGWSEEKTVSWALEHYSDELRGKNSLFQRETPSYYIIELFVSKERLISLGPRKTERFIQDFEMAIDYTRNTLDPDYDWAAARQRVNEVLKEIGASLPE